MQRGRHVAISISYLARISNEEMKSAVHFLLPALYSGPFNFFSIKLNLRKAGKVEIDRADIRHR